MPIATIAVTSSLLEKGGVCPGIMKISGHTHHGHRQLV